ncbi:MAG: ABC transporter ATP-binding protein [Coriobacteriales bacterium]|nr:ABC transporter ATP-binding protein [Coriobacteriales bacterium]
MQADSPPRSTVVFRGVSKEYSSGEQSFKALDDASFTLEAGEFVVILGPSGAGKSTLLNLLGGMDFASEGSILVGGANIVGLGDRELTRYRAQQVGFVFQFYNLIPTLTARENIALIHSVKTDALDATGMLAAVGLSDHVDQFPAQLSGGEQQRVSIARALAKNPTLLLADEPTGALDSETGIAVLELLWRMSREHGTTVVVVTHNALLAQAADRVIHLRNGQVTQVATNAAPLSISEIRW